jgi:hypothetical protein
VSKSGKSRSPRKRNLEEAEEAPQPLDAIIAITSEGIVAAWRKKPPPLFKKRSQLRKGRMCTQTSTLLL